MIDKATRYFIERKRRFLTDYIPNGLGRVSLDVGSNFGEITELMLKHGYNSIGIDVDKGVLGHARLKGNAVYLPMDIQDTTFPKESFDVIIMFDILEHVLDRGMALKEVNRLLKKDGIAIISVPNTWSYFFIRSFLTYFLKGKKPYKNVHYQQNYFYWEHLISQFLDIKEVKPILAVPFFEPKLIRQNRLAEFEFGMKSAWYSALPIFICTKKKKYVEANTDTTGREAFREVIDPPAIYKELQW